MDLKRWQWRNPWEKCIPVLCTLLFLNLLFLHHGTASETSYHQDPKNKIQDPNKLDSLSNYLPFDSSEDSEYKRASSFFPLRGKKSSSDDSLGDHQLFMSNQDASEDKRAQFYPLRGKKVPDDLKRASYFMPMRGRKDDGWMEDYDITEESANKRASSFMPMRGKKRYVAISDYLTKAGTYPNDVSEVLSPSGSQGQIADKRLQSFVPVRGKRSLEESSSNGSQVLSNDSNDTASNHSTKKRSVSFTPMRGRREFDESRLETPERVVTSLLEKKNLFIPESKYDDYEDPSRFDKKASSFMPMRGRRNFGDDKNSEKEDFIEFKRAQSFMPMRGRRAQLRDVVYGSDFSPDMESRLIEDKRASSFMPMRGRRSVSEDAARHDDEHYKFDKKASSFMPMRGRRSTTDGENVRSQNESKSDKGVASIPRRDRRFVEDNSDVESRPADQLYSLQDKKSSAFMPMRGRKYEAEDFTVAPWSPTDLMSLLNKKSSAFMPMRGRSSDAEDFTVAPWPADQLMPLLDKKSSAFMPMRGRRYDDENFRVTPSQADQLMPLLDKKSAFVPSRGRRTSMDDNDEQNANIETDKRSSSFMPMRGRRLEMDQANFYNPYPYLMAGIGSSLMSKPYSDKGVSFISARSPEARRKKLRINWDAVKRAFHATRGKRVEFTEDLVDSQKDNYSNESQSSGETNEPAVNETFKQPRTKRSIIRPRVSMQPSRTYIALKRPMSFFATRGKRLEDSTIDKLSKLR